MAKSMKVTGKNYVPAYKKAQIMNTVAASSKAYGRAIDPSLKKASPLLSIVGALLTGTSAQQDYVVDHYISFYGYPVKVSHSALSCLQKLPTFKNWTALSPEK